MLVIQALSKKPHDRERLDAPIFVVIPTIMILSIAPQRLSLLIPHTMLPRARLPDPRPSDVHYTRRPLKRCESAPLGQTASRCITLRQGHRPQQ